MNPVLVRKIILPIHERLTKRSTLAYLKNLERTQWWTRDRLLELQDRKLRDLLCHAARHAPYYSNLFTRLGVDARSDDPRDVLSSLPTLTKKKIRQHVDRMVWHEAPGGIHRYATGGSTGQPLQFYFDRRRQAYDQAARMRTHRWFDVDVGQREVFLWGAPLEMSRQDRLHGIRDRFVNHRLLNAFDLSETKLDDYLVQIERYQPASLFGYPSSLAHLVRHAEKKGRSLHLPKLKAIFVTGEVLCEADRAAIQGYFGVPVANGYGSREGGFIAHECSAGGMHMTDENVICECLDDRGAAVRPGKVGGIVVTHLDAYARPFIRNRTGDLACLPQANRCPCGRGPPRLEHIEGRKTDSREWRDDRVRSAVSLITIRRGPPGAER